MDAVQFPLACLPAHDRVDCALCHRNSPVVFNQTRTVSEKQDWRVTANPLAWGNPHAEILVLGFSKGPNALGALATKPHDDIPFAGKRRQVRKILARIGVMDMEADIGSLIASQAGQFAWGSLIRCTVERQKAGNWKSSGGGMLDKFVATPFGHQVASNCAKKFLKNFPDETKLVVLFGLGEKLNYVREARKVIEMARGGANLCPINEVAYTDGLVTFVHVEHFASQGSHIPDWCGEPNSKKGNAISTRSRLGDLAFDAAHAALYRSTR